MGGFIIRNMKHKITEQIGTEWQENILSVGVQDQIILFFIFDKNKKIKWKQKKVHRFQNVFIKNN